MLHTRNPAEIAGLRSMDVDAKDEAAKAFYERHGFKPFQDEPIRRR